MARYCATAPEGEGAPSLVVLCPDTAEGLQEDVSRVRAPNPDAAVVVFGSRLDLPLAHAALRAGACGFAHAQLEPEQVLRAARLAVEGKLVAPRQLIDYLISLEGSAAPILSSRQEEVLGLVRKGLSNAQIAKSLFLSESTVKQHLRAAYKALGVKNRTEAVRLLRENGD